MPGSVTIGGHPARFAEADTFFDGMPRSPYANEKRVCSGRHSWRTTPGGRSNGVQQAGSRSDAEQIIPLLKKSDDALTSTRNRRDIKGGCRKPSRPRPGRICPTAPYWNAVLPEANRRSEILVKRIPRTAPRSIPQGPGTGPRATPGDLQAVDS